MRRQAPPLEATEAFLVAARAPSFRAAADEIALSPSAFSRRIQLLESFVGVPLFDRTGPVVRLTDAGQRYYAEVSPALEAIRRATVQLREQAGSRMLKLVTSHSLAVAWLLPRLTGLMRDHDIEIDLAISREAQSLRSGAADLAIWGGRSDDGEFPHERLIDLSAVLAAAPVLADGRPLPARIAEVSGHRLLTARSPQRYWRNWLDCMDPAGEIPEPAAGFDTTELCYEAAASGMGLTLAVPLLSEKFVREGRLVKAIGPAVKLGFDYSLFFASAEIARRPAVRTFSHWLYAEACASADNFGTWATSSGLTADPVPSAPSTGNRSAVPVRPAAAPAQSLMAARS